MLCEKKSHMIFLSSHFSAIIHAHLSSHTYNLDSQRFHMRLYSSALRIISMNRRMQSVKTFNE